MSVNMDDVRDEVRRALWGLHQMADELEAEFLSTEGEVTETTDQYESLTEDQVIYSSEACARYVSEIEGREIFLKGEADKIADARAQMKRRGSWVFARMRMLVERYGKGKTKKIAAGPFVLSLRASKRVEQVEDGLDLLLLPEQFIRLGEPNPDKTAIKAALKAGESVRGFALIERKKVQVKRG